MSKRLGEDVSVTLDDRRARHGVAVPKAFRWRERRYRVTGVLGHWREDAAYWAGGGMHVPQRDLWRVEAVAGGRASGVFELVCQEGHWRLDRVWD